MLRIMANEAQLATVLGHEVGHVTARHAAQRIVAENAVTLTLRLGASLLAWSDTPIPPQLVVALGGSLADVGLIRPFGRAQELQADALGLATWPRPASIPRSDRVLAAHAALETGDRPPAFLVDPPDQRSADRGIEAAAAESRRPAAGLTES